LAGELLKKGQLLVGESGTYSEVKQLGLAGATSRVYLLKRKEDEKLFALKMMQSNLSREMKTHFHAEMVNLQRLCIAEDRAGTRHIPRIIESSDLQQSKTQQLLHLLGNPFIIMDFADGIDINTLLMEKKTLTEEESLIIAKQFVEVLVVIHGEGLTYTDMKLSNLIWNAEEEHLVVIDWNVIAEDRLETDAPKDRLRAAAYLFHMATGIPLDLDMSGKGSVNQKYRQLEKFKNLSEGVQAFLKKAFHPNPLSRHGADGTQLQCTRELLRELEDHLDRYKLTAENLVSEGESAFRDRQWEDAVLYLDLAAHKINIEEKPAQFAHIQEILGDARNEANKLGRNAFHSGHARYDNGMFPEALADFKRAMQDNPYDEEARLYAILTQFAQEVGEEEFLKCKEPLEECIGSLLKGHFDLAGNSLSRLPGIVAKKEEIRSLKAEIIVRKAVHEGQRLLKADKITEARESFRTANREKGHLIHVQSLEENLGSLTKLCHDAEDLEKLYEEVNADIKEERFHDALLNAWKARKISGGSELANRNFHFASLLYKIQKYLEEARPENAYEQCKTTSRFDSEPAFQQLKAKAKVEFVEQLRDAVDQYFLAEKYAEAKECNEKLLELKPDDKAAKIKSEEIEKKIEVGYLKFLEQEKNNAEKDTSLQSIDESIQRLKKKGYEKFSEVREFIQWAKKIKEVIILLSEELHDRKNNGDINGQLEVFNKAIAKKFKLKQGDPEHLKKELLLEILESKISKIQTHLINYQPQSTLDICKKMNIEELTEGKKRFVQQSMEKANKLLVAKEELENVKRNKLKLSHLHEAAKLEKLRLEENHLRIHKRMKEIEPHLEIPLDLKDYDTRLHTLSQDLGDYAENLQRRGNSCLLNHDFAGAKAIVAEMEDALSLLKNLEDHSVKTGRGILESWNREFKGLVGTLETKKSREVDFSADYRVIMAEILLIITNPRVKEVISILNTTPGPHLETRQKELEELEILRKDSPAAFWFYQFLEKERNVNRVWNAMALDAATAETLIQQYIAAHEREDYENPLKVARAIEGFLKDRENGDEETQPDLETLAANLEQATRLRESLQDIPGLRGKEIEQRLVDHISHLRHTISARQNAVIKEHVKKLETLLEELYQKGGEGPVIRGSLETQAAQEIEGIRVLNEEKARHYETRLEKCNEQLARESKNKSSKEHAEKLENLLNELPHSGENHISRLRLEDKAREIIEKLRELDEKKADQLEKRLIHLLDAFLDPIPLEARTKVKDWKYLNELQRQVCERHRLENNNDVLLSLETVARIPKFEKQIPVYKKKHENMLYKLERLKRKPGIIPLESLQKLREEFGEFPEIDDAVEETRYEMSREIHKKKIDYIYKEFPRVRGRDEWQTIDAAFAEIDPSFLDQPDQAKYAKLKSDIQFHLMMNETIPRDQLLKFLENSETQYVQDRLNALERNVFAENSRYSPSAETLENIRQSERIWLDRQQVNFKKLQPWRWIKFLAREANPAGSTSTTTITATAKRTGKDFS
jgi:hypothetical protein